MTNIFNSCCSLQKNIRPIDNFFVKKRFHGMVFQNKSYVDKTTPKTIFENLVKRSGSKTITR